MMLPLRSKRTGLATALGALLLTVAACGDSTTTATDDSDSDGGAVAAPASVPAAAGKVTGLGMVIDYGDGPQICFGPIGESYPPSCQGSPLAGWDWKSVEGFEFIQKTRFGMYAVTGTFDGTTLTVTDPPISAALYDPTPDPFAVKSVETRCSAPDGGWAVTDPTKASANALEDARAIAVGLDGYSGDWIDQFAEVTVPDYSADPDPDPGDDGPMEPLPIVLNVLLDGDTDAAAAAIGEAWGGALCVRAPENSAADLEAAATQLAGAPGVLTADPFNDRVLVNTLYDDGGLQAFADSEFGEGVVIVSPSLRPVG